MSIKSQSISNINSIEKIIINSQYKSQKLEKYIIKNINDEFYIENIPQNNESINELFKDNVNELEEEFINDLLDDSMDLSEEYNENENKTFIEYPIPNLKNLPSQKTTTKNLKTEKLQHCTLNTKECTICFEYFNINDNVLKIIKCNHIYHLECLNNWILTKGFLQCPLCKD